MEGKLPPPPKRERGGREEEGENREGGERERGIKQKRHCLKHHIPYKMYATYVVATPNFHS